MLSLLSLFFVVLGLIVHRLFPERLLFFFETVHQLVFVVGDKRYGPVVLIPFKWARHRLNGGSLDDVRFLAVEGVPETDTRLAVYEIVHDTVDGGFWEPGDGHELREPEGDPVVAVGCRIVDL